MKKIYIITDLGPGDGGKGGVVHRIATMTRAHTVVKVGGAQGSHGVATSKGEHFAFSQWGCGTLEGVRTYLSPRFIVAPEGLLNEAHALHYQCGIHNPFSLLTIDEEALCATPYHGIASRLKELARGGNPRGTIGTGVGEAFRYSEEWPELNIRARDLVRLDLKDKLAAVREQIRDNLSDIMLKGFLLTDCKEADREIDRLNDNGFFDYVVKRFREVSKLAHVVDRNYVKQKIFAQDGIAIVESSHGVLTDCYYGFHPHTSAIRTLPCFTQAMLKDIGYDGSVVNIGVSRAYQIRHGAGPMPTANQAMRESLLPGSHKEENRYQGKVRVGPLDFVLLRYAIEVCGGSEEFDGLAITWFDQIQTNGAWHVCDGYHGMNDETYFSETGRLKVHHGTDVFHLSYQEAIGKQLLNCIPEITTYKVSATEREKNYQLCADVLKERIGVPVRMVSFGPTEQDKIYK